MGSENEGVCSTAVHTFDGAEEDVKMIGVYSSPEQAQSAIERLKSQLGFADTPEGFEIDLYILDEDQWTEGYVTVNGHE